MSHVVFHWLVHVILKLIVGVNWLRDGVIQLEILVLHFRSLRSGLIANQVVVALVIVRVGNSIRVVLKPGLIVRCSSISIYSLGHLE